MSRARRILQSLQAQPAYTLMRGMARFRSVRSAVGRVRRSLHAERLRAQLAACEMRMGESLFASLDRQKFVTCLRADGIAFGLRLPADLCADILAHAARTPCFADRQAALGFPPERRAEAEAALGKPILVAQYFNTEREANVVRRLMDDPALQWIAAAYLESMPSFVGANLWWTFAVDASAEDRDRHAHLFHRDVDDFRFFKFFFYLTEVRPGDGAHVCVRASHHRVPLLKPGDRWNIRRYSDAEIERSVVPDEIVEICGPAGTGFAENTLCLHKGMTPQREPRLLLQLQYALFDYGVMHDLREPAMLRMIA